MKITDLRATRSRAFGGTAPARQRRHWGRFVRTIVEVETEEGLVARRDGRRRGRAPSSPSRASNPTCWDTTPLSRGDAVQDHEPPPRACTTTGPASRRPRVRLPGRGGSEVGVPVHDLLGGKTPRPGALRQLLVLRYADPETGEGEFAPQRSSWEHAEGSRGRKGSPPTSSRAEFYPPAHELECYRALAEAFPRTPCATTRTRP